MEWICADHWLAIPKLQRRVYARAKRRGKPAAVLAVIWERLKAVAIERAGGIG
jgi:hypothetical protein